MNSNAKLNTIATLDLGPIKAKIMHKQSGEGWSMEQTNAVEFEYRRFLCLAKLFPHEQTAPLFDVDIFWHYHILDTVKYAADCEKIFGYFLHHYPYVGLHGEEDEADHQRVGARMLELYEATFGETYRSHAVQAPAQKTAFASAWCSNVAQNDPFYSVRPVLLDAHKTRSLTAWCSNLAQNDGSNPARPAIQGRSASALTAWCSNTAQNDKAYSVRPVSKEQADAATTAWCSNVAQNDSAYSASPYSQVHAVVAATAWCSNVAHNDSALSARSVLQEHGAKAITAWCSNVVQNDSSYSMPSVLAQAA